MRSFPSCSSNAPDGFRHATRALPNARPVAEDAGDAHAQLAGSRFLRHLRKVKAGRQPDNHIDPYALSRTCQSVLKTAFSIVRDPQDLVARRHGIS